MEGLTVLLTPPDRRASHVHIPPPHSYLTTLLDADTHHSARTPAPPAQVMVRVAAFQEASAMRRLGVLALVATVATAAVVVLAAGAWYARRGGGGRCVPVLGV